MSIQATHWDDCWKSGPEHYECARAEVERLREAEAELHEIASVLPGVAYMDPPDGGSPSLSEQFRRMRADLDCIAAERDALRAEVERLTDLADKYKWQVRDTCTRAEKAEAEVERLWAVLAASKELLAQSDEYRLDGGWGSAAMAEYWDALADAIGAARGEL